MRILTRPNVGGPTVQAAALFAAHRALGVSTLLVVGKCDQEPALDLTALGVPAAGEIGPRASGWHVVPELAPGWRLRGSRAATRALAAVIERFAPDVVHTHTSRAGWLGRRAAMACRVPVIAHTFHGHVLHDYFGPLRSWLLTRLERRLASQTDLLFAVSPSCAEELAARRVAARERLVVCWPAVPLPQFLDRRAARTAVGLGAGDFAVACLGRLVPIKRIDHFLAAVALLPDGVGHGHGDGPLAARLRQQAAPLGGRLRLLASSPLARRALPAYDALVLPSIREGCPLVAVEAFAAGVPVVGYDVPGVRDVVTLGGGLLVPPAAGPAGLCGALRTLRADPSVRAAAVAAGRAALANFDPQVIARRLLDGYEHGLRT